MLEQAGEFVCSRGNRSALNDTAQLDFLSDTRSWNVFPVHSIEIDAEEESQHCD